MMFRDGGWSVYRCDSVSCLRLVLRVRAAVTGLSRWRTTRLFWFDRKWYIRVWLAGGEKEVVYLQHDCDLPFAHYQKIRPVLLCTAERQHHGKTKTQFRFYDVDNFVKICLHLGTL